METKVNDKLKELNKKNWGYDSILLIRDSFLLLLSILVIFILADVISSGKTDTPVFLLISLLVCHSIALILIAINLKRIIYLKMNQRNITRWNTENPENK